MGAIAPIMLVAQTGLKLAEINQTAKAQEQAYKNQAQLMENRAQVERVQASQAADQGAAEERKIQSNLAAANARNRARAGAGGLEASGSLLDVNQANEAEAATDLKTSLQNQRYNTWAYRVSEAQNLANAESYKNAASAVRKNAKTQMWSTVLGAAASAYGSGMFGGSGSASVYSTDSADSWLGSSYNPYKYLNRFASGDWTYGDSKKSWGSLLGN